MRDEVQAKVINEKLFNLFGFILLTLVCAALTYFIINSDIKKSALAVMGLVAIPFVVLSLANFRFAFYAMIFLSIAMVVINRVLLIHMPYGSFIDAMLGLIFLLILGRQILQQSMGSKLDSMFSEIRNPITIVLLIWVAYWLIEISNPEGSIPGWIYGIRKVLRLLMIYLLAFKLFDSLKFIKQFTTIYLCVGIVVALYGIYQEFAGFPWFDLKYATATETRINLLYVGGKWRRFSMLTDPAVFGLFMGLIAIMASLLSLGHCSLRKRSFYIITSILAIFAMLYSGTRTAYAMIPIAFVIYVMLNLSNIRALIFAAFSVLVFLVIYFGPFYSKSIVRFRSAFNPSEDTSMQLRDMNRASIQPYIHSHPFGGGLTTTGSYGEKYSPGHFLAGFPPDGGFMSTLLELGWVGLLLELILYSVILAMGVTSYYRSRSPEMKLYFAMFISSFFALTIAYYAKNAVDQFPINFFLYGTPAILIKLRKFDQENS